MSTGKLPLAFPTLSFHVHIQFCPQHLSRNQCDTPRACTTARPKAEIPLFLHRVEGGAWQLTRALNDSARGMQTTTSTVCGMPRLKNMGTGNADISPEHRPWAPAYQEREGEASCPKTQAWTSVRVTPLDENMQGPALAHPFSFWNKKNKFGTIKVLDCWLEDLHVDKVLFSSPGSLGSKTEKLCVIKMETVSISCDSLSCGKNRPMRKDCSCPLQPLHIKILLKISNPLKHKPCKQNLKEISAGGGLFISQCKPYPEELTFHPSPPAVMPLEFKD